MIEGDGNKAQLQQVNELLSLSNQKIQVKDSIISTLDLRIYKLQTNLTFKNEQFDLQKQLTVSLKKELRQEKRKTFFFKITTGLGVITTLMLLSK